MKPFWLQALIAIAALAAIAAVLLLTPLGRTPLDTLFPVGDVAPVEFATLTLSDRPNRYLVCPAGYCRAQPDAESPVFNVTAHELRARWQALVAAEPRAALLAEWNDLDTDYVQRSALLRFPDVISVRFIPLTGDRSTLAVYSRSIYGRSDFGVNRQRIEDWLAKLRERTAQDG